MKNFIYLVIFLSIPFQAFSKDQLNLFQQADSFKDKIAKYDETKAYEGWWIEEVRSEIVGEFWQLRHEFEVALYEGLICIEDANIFNELVVSGLKSDAVKKKHINKRINLYSGLTALKLLILYPGISNDFFREINMYSASIKDCDPFFFNIDIFGPTILEKIKLVSNFHQALVVAALIESCVDASYDYDLALKVQNQYQAEAFLALLRSCCELDSPIFFEKALRVGNSDQALVFTKLAEAKYQGLIYYDLVLKIREGSDKVDEFLKLIENGSRNEKLFQNIFKY